MVQFDSEALWFIMKHLFFIIHIYNTEDELRAIQRKSTCSNHLVEVIDVWLRLAHQWWTVASD